MPSPSDLLGSHFPLGGRNCVRKAAAEHKLQELKRQKARSEAEPSAADRALTQRLKESLALVDVRTLDHIVVTGSSTTSFAERGLI